MNIAKYAAKYNYTYDYAKCMVLQRNLSRLRQYRHLANGFYRRNTAYLIAARILRRKVLLLQSL